MSFTHTRLNEQENYTPNSTNHVPDTRRKFDIHEWYTPHTINVIFYPLAIYIPNITQKNTNKYKNILFQNDGHVGMANQAKGHKQDGNDSQMQVRETKPKGLQSIPTSTLSIYCTLRL